MSYNTRTGVVSAQRYTPYGAPRATSGTLPTDYRFTGQRSEEATLGSLYDYNARFYSPALGRFLSPDTLVPAPGNPSHGDSLRSQALNRYSYVLNNPLRYVDADGHLPIVPVLIVGAVVALKAVDYGWTAWDSYQSLKVIHDPSTKWALGRFIVGFIALRSDGLSTVQDHL